jgi:hypothetical protein
VIPVVSVSPSTIPVLGYAVPIHASGEVRDVGEPPADRGALPTRIETGRERVQRTVAYFVVQLALYSVVMAWIPERTDRSLLVAIAMHAGAHLDNTDQAPMSEVRLVALRFAVLAGVAALAAWDLQARRRVAIA